MQDNSKINSTERFSDRVEDYKKHRPDYPSEVTRILQEKQALHDDATVADIGSGTGHLTKILLPHTDTVYAVEPNEAMRREAERTFADAKNFISVNGTAEVTTLPDHCIDLITAAQAFHWFDAKKARTEFIRILKPGGSIALVWNLRDVDADHFQRDYETALRSHIPEYKDRHKRTASDEHIFSFFAPAQVEIFRAANEQSFNLAALKGRLFSSSYTPKPPDPAFDSLMRDIENLFDRYNTDGYVRFIYKTTLYIGQLG